jgi:hypothetical protein
MTWRACSGVQGRAGAATTRLKMNGGPAMTINLRRKTHDVAMEKIVTKSGRELGCCGELCWDSPLDLRKNCNTSRKTIGSEYINIILMSQAAQRLTRLHRAASDLNAFVRLQQLGGRTREKSVAPHAHEA